MSNKYLQQATGAFQPIASTDLTTALTSYSAVANANSTTSSTNFSIIPNCTLTQGSSGIWLVSGYGSMLNSAAAEGFYLQITDGTTADVGATVIAKGAVTSAAAGYTAFLSLMGIATSPSSQLTLQWAPTTVTATTNTVNGLCGISAVRIG